MSLAINCVVVTTVTFIQARGLLNLVVLRARQNANIVIDFHLANENMMSRVTGCSLSLTEYVNVKFRQLRQVSRVVAVASELDSKLCIQLHLIIRRFGEHIRSNLIR